MKKNIFRLDLHISTKCNLKCKHCCAGSPNKEHGKNDWYMSLDEIQKVADVFYGIQQIHLMGGEPTLHPDFETLVPQFKTLFGCKELVITTNGTGFKRFPEVFRYFDCINISRYIKGEKHNYDNGEDILFLWDNYPDIKFNVIRADHTPLNTVGGGKMCNRGIDGVISYVNGLLYPCCVADGVPDAVGIPVTKDWDKEIREVKMPCETCFFSVA